MSGVDYERSHDARARTVYRMLARVSDYGRRPEVLPIHGMHDVSRLASCSAGAAPPYQSCATTLLPTPRRARQWNHLLHSERRRCYRTPSIHLRMLSQRGCRLLLSVARFSRVSAADSSCTRGTTTARSGMHCNRPGGMANHGGERRFVHLSERPGRSSCAIDINEASAASDAVGTMITIVQSTEMPYGRLILDCLGSRCRIVDRRRGKTDGRTLHVLPSLVTDPRPDDSDGDATIEALRARLATRMTLRDFSRLHHQNGLLPPLFCAERLSFFTCGLLLPNDDCEARQACLFSTDTRSRLEFCKSAMMAMEGMGWEKDDIVDGSFVSDSDTRAGASPFVAVHHGAGT